MAFNLVTPPSPQSPSSAPGPMTHAQPNKHRPPPGPTSRRDEARDEARRARVVALLQEAVNEECFGPPTIQVTGEHADAVAALLTGGEHTSSRQLDRSEREELERLRQHGLPTQDERDELERLRLGYPKPSDSDR